MSHKELHGCPCDIVSISGRRNDKSIRKVEKEGKIVTLPLLLPWVTDSVSSMFLVLNDIIVIPVVVKRAVGNNVSLLLA